MLTADNKFVSQVILFAAFRRRPSSDVDKFVHKACPIARVRCTALPPVPTRSGEIGELCIPFIELQTLCPDAVGVTARRRRGAVQCA